MRPPVSRNLTLLAAAIKRPESRRLRRAARSTFARPVRVGRTPGTPVASASDKAMPDSVAPYLRHLEPADALAVAKVADRLYVHRFARKCPAGVAACSEVPLAGPGQVGLSDGEEYHFFARAYREPTARYGPAPREILHPYLLISRPRL
jgi:hypothetical protein